MSIIVWQWLHDAWRTTTNNLVSASSPTVKSVKPFSGLCKFIQHICPTWHLDSGSTYRSRKLCISINLNLVRMETNYSRDYEPWIRRRCRPGKCARPLNQEESAECILDDRILSASPEPAFQPTAARSSSPKPSTYLLHAADVQQVKRTEIYFTNTKAVL